MPLATPAAMVLFYNFEGDPRDHDDWHSREHFAERLSVPGFRRATRYLAEDAPELYLVLYEVDDVEVATSSPTSTGSTPRPSGRGRPCPAFAA